MDNLPIILWLETTLSLILSNLELLSEDMLIWVEWPTIISLLLLSWLSETMTCVVHFLDILRFAHILSTLDQVLSSGFTLKESIYIQGRHKLTVYSLSSESESILLCFFWEIVISLSLSSQRL